MDRPNIVVVISDTLRASHLGCYGNTRVSTPQIDAFARSATRFTRAYPESLPTIPVRRAMHSGRRAFPFRNYSPVRWDIVKAPGWEPMERERDTAAENLVQAGYHTGFVTDTLPYFAPGMNFTRGFWQWEFVRGKLQDRWKSPFTVSPEQLARYSYVVDTPRRHYGVVPYHLANTAHVKTEEETTTARVFQWGMNFLEDNRGAQPFYLLMDCFDPHEPWEAPERYYRMYGQPDYHGRRLVHCTYGPAAPLGYSEEEIAFVQAHYCGLVTLVDTWFGEFLRKLAALGLEGNTAVFFISDHGTNFCDNPRGIIGKPEYALYPGVMQLPLLARLPQARAGAAGTVRTELVYNLDVPATVCDLAGVAGGDGLDGQSLLPLLNGAGAWRSREHVTCRYGEFVCCIEDQAWVVAGIDGQARDVFDPQADPLCQNNIVESDGGKRSRRAWELILQDAGGALPAYNQGRTDAIGQKIVKER